MINFIKETVASIGYNPFAIPLLTALFIAVTFIVVTIDHMIFY